MYGNSSHKASFHTFAHFLHSERGHCEHRTWRIRNVQINVRINRNRSQNRIRQAQRASFRFMQMAFGPTAITKTTTTITTTKYQVVRASRQ
ncbi:unnamed protein product [Ceratitis capitata]|uniref:(Mediterranean fruit fly) hypothetical protein n=1 Tax=Ceratitis capitata TaxID=7213 RepID=A0A811V2E6_CERCA|nr:unnamed protein product [Ceratitis capitata]